MAAAAPVRPLNVNIDDTRQGNRCPICQEWEAPSWRGRDAQYRQECCGVLICMECLVDWRGEQGNTDAMNNLTKVLYEPEGALSNPTQMVLMRAAAKGSVNAQKTLPQWEKHILSQCASCGKPSAAMAGAPLKCARCKAAAYCAAACQKQHWKRGGHKKECNGRERYLPENE